MLVLEQNLTGRASAVLHDVPFNDWPTVRIALQERLTTHNTVERVEAKIFSLKQRAGEVLEEYAQRAETLLDELNRSYGTDNDVLRRENDRKTRRSFEQGISNRQLKERAVIRSADTLRDSINYVIGQKVSMFNNTISYTPRFERTCNFCGGAHLSQDCRRGRMSLGNYSRPKRYY